MELTERDLVFGDIRVPYRYGADCLPDLVDTVAARLADADAVLVVADRQVKDHAGRLTAPLARHLRVETFTLDAVEAHKTLFSVQAILEYATERKLTRRSAILAMGGGTVGNVAGLAAALLYRGTRLVHAPTTPVAAFDAVISLKQGVNLPAGKNLCGAYFPPSLIACDLRWLSTVPQGNLHTGLAEMAKNILVAVPNQRARFVRAMADLRHRPMAALRDLLEIGIEAKQPYLTGDPHERGPAVVFEYGHTVGHAVEFASAGAIGHGEAVAWGMLVAAELGRRIHGLDRDTVQEHHRLTALLGLPEAGDRFRRLDRAAVLRALTADNKRGYADCAPDEVLMVLLDGPGRPVRGEDGRPLVPVPVAEVMDALDTVIRSMGAGAASGQRSGVPR
ncbi:iron-containing alcohol dehydrogenase [Plantactinospora sp. ZYX-F-223]|uniref:3-dehydroquinate synthase family protein n=1 Tax=Plantactinospora sp. ZYX-F-223 TaxID=3144103 RepID=UPI0031FD9C30